MKSSALDRILGKIEDLDPANLTILAQRLGRERQLLETVFNTIQEGILVITASGVIKYANQSARLLIQLADEEVGQAILWKWAPDLASSLDVASLKDEASSVSREVYVSYPESRYLRLYVMPFDYPLAEASGESLFAVILTDITEAKASTDELIEEEKLASIFLLAGGVAHEIGNPLNSINIHLQLMQRNLDKLQESTEKQKLADSILVCTHEIERLDSIVKNFLHAIKPVQPQLCDLNIYKLLDEVLAVVSHELEDLGVRVDVQFQADLPTILGDPDQIKQVFFNIIKNAMEAMDRGGELLISTKTNDQFLFVQLKDTGVGIDPDHMAKIFTPYYSTKRSGHGLGMTIIQRILRAHGAQIHIDSKVDAGTVVALQFPLKERRVRLLEAQ